jgi:hypothetical protein
MADPVPSRRIQLRTLLIVAAVFSVWAWGAGQLYDKAWEYQWLWETRHAGPTNTPPPDHLLIDEGTVFLVMLLSLAFGVFVILWGKKHQEHP